MEFASGIKLVMPFWLDAAAIAIAMVVGMISGLLPANKAANMAPMDAIRR